MKTIIATTTDGKPIFWGKKESDDTNSEDLTLWVTVGTPRKDGANYRRVPASEEAHLSDVLKYNMAKWKTHLDKVISGKSAKEIRAWEPAR